MTDAHTGGDVIIRDAEVLDAEQIRAIDLACFSEPDSVDIIAQQIAAPSVIVKLCVLDGCAVSYCSAMSVLDELQIINVATLPTHTSNGYAKRVLSAVIEDARGNGTVTASLEVRASNSAAIHVYECAGFKACGVRRGFYRKPVEDAVIMVADLAAERLE